jgi:hypothetical protein
MQGFWFSEMSRYGDDLEGMRLAYTTLINLIYLYGSDSNYKALSRVLNLSVGDTKLLMSGYYKAHKSEFIRMTADFVYHNYQKRERLNAKKKENR